MHIIICVYTRMYVYACNYVCIMNGILHVKMYTVCMYRTLPLHNLRCAVYVHGQLVALPFLKYKRIAQSLSMCYYVW